MNPKERFRSAATGIADDILKQARSDDQLLYWMTAAIGPDGKTAVWRASADLYSGTSGIALFLLDAGHALGKPAYLEAALGALAWCERTAARDQNHSFYLGRLGIAFARLRAAAITGDSRHLEHALRLAEGYESYVANATVNDLLGGLAGSMVGFLHLHQQTREPWIIKAIHALAGRLASTARWTPEGLCWDVRGGYIKGLCGMSHGAAGVAFALLEADAYLDEPAYRRLALEALRYETAHYDAEQATWPDFRKISSPMTEEQAALPDAILSTPSMMDAWCHGAPGIALSRLRAMELLGAEWHDDCLRAIARTRLTIGSATAASNFTLCHGACGNAVAVLEASRVLGDARYRAWAEEIGERAIASRDRDGFYYSGYASVGRPEDLSLMMGNAGIAQFFLQLAGDAANVLSPRVTADERGEGSSVNIGTVVRALAGGLLPASMAAIEARSGAESRAFLDRWRERGELLAFVADECSRVGAAEQFALDSQKLRMLAECPSFALVTVVQARDNDRLAGIATDKLTSCRLQLAAFSQIWRSQVEADPPRLLRIVNAQVTELALSEFSASLLEACTAPTTLDSVIRSLEQIMETKTSQATTALRQIAETQVLGMLSAGLIVVVES